MKKVYFLFVLACLFFNYSFAQSIINPSDAIVNYNSSSPPTQPAWGTIGKWVRTPRLSWNTTEYKCYIYEGYAFRIHFPKSYNPTANDGKKYPMLVFFHGLGEAGTIYDNEYQLYHGGDVFQKAVDNGTFDGYVLCMQSQGFWGGTQYQAISEIINYMVANNKLDPFAITCNGLSAGGQGTWEMMFSHPSYVAADIPMSAAAISYTNTDTVNKVKYTPIWNIQGGLDGSPAPYTSDQVRQAMVAGGANYTYTLFSTLGHDTWDSTWLLPNFWPYVLRAYGSNPWPLYGRTQFCPGDNINVTLGLAQGFQAYQWRYQGNVINTATTNTIKATQAGVYDARVERNGVWSDWSRTPVNIVVQGSTPTPPIQVAGLMSMAIPSADGKNYVNLQVSGSNSNYISYTWKKVGSDSVYSTSAIFTATQPGYYIVAANQQYSCSSSFSIPFKVIDANGPNAPASAKSLTANALSNTQIQLAWSSAAQQANPPIAFEIYRKPAGGSYAFVGQSGPSATTYSDSLLAPKAKYFYEVRAIDSTGAASVSNEASATTYSDTTAPTIPVNLKTTYTTPSTISIAWTASTDNVSVDHYNIYVNGALSNVTKQTSFVLTGLVQSQPYAIYVKAVDGSNNISSASNQITAEPILGGLNYSFYTTANAWTALPNFSTLTPAAQGISANTDITVATQSTNYGFLWQGYIQVPVNGTYMFQTTSDDGSALWFNSINPTGTPTVNNDGAHSSGSKTSASLTLTAGIYPICIEYFQATGGASMSVSWACSALYGNTTQHTIPNTYFVGTYVNAGSVPTKPSSVAALATAYNKINVTWKDNSNNETGFEVYRATSVNGTYAIAGTTGANATSYSDSGLTASTKYYYKVQAINKYGNSGLAGQDTSAGSNGLNYSFYTGGWSVLPAFTSLTPVKTGVSTNIDLSPATQTTNYGFMWQGYIKITTAGSYTFGTTSDDGSALYFNSLIPTATPTVNNDGLHGSTAVAGSAMTLAVGTYPICITYFQSGGGAAMSATYMAPGKTTQSAIPSTAFYKLAVSAVPSATTLALPATPAAPANFKATAKSTSQIVLSWTASSGATGYKILRSIGDNSHYTLLSNVGSSITSYNDSGLNANLIHYYQIMAAGVGGLYSSASAASATTQDNKPVITHLPATAVPYGVTTTIPINATDADGDVLTYTSLNLPAFASLNGSSLVINPAQSNQGIYNNVTIIVSDPYGGKDTTIFNLTVNNNFAPSIDPIANYTMNENDVVNIPLTAHDQNNGDVLTWSVASMPNAYTLTNNGNGSATLSVHPNYLAAGTYNPVVTVNDGNGGTTTRSFTITVKDVNPNTNIYVRFQYTDTIGKPWNSLTNAVTNNLIDANNGVTNIGLAVQGSWFTTYNTGSPTGNNSGIYPDAVLEDYLYFGIFGGPETLDTKLTDLDTSRLYNLTFFASSVFPGTTDNGHTIYTVGSQSVSLEVQNNQKNTVSINGIKPAADGTITYHMAKGSDAQVGYINALVIQSIYDDGTAPVAATSLAAQNITGGVQLTWTDVAYNETGYYVYRALTSNGVYSLIGQTQAGATNFIDSTVSGNVQYSYEVAAFNAYGNSPYSNVATITTTDRIPKINAIADVAIKNNQTATINITAIDDATDHLTFSVSGLPSFAKLVDNGNGTATISVTPSSNNLGGYPVTITVTDNSNATASTSFNILVADPNVSSTYLSFSDGAHSVPKPWNMLAGYPFANTAFKNIVDDSNSPTGITVTFKNGFQGVIESGMQPVDGLGIYPNVVMRTAEYESSTKKDTIVVSGLSTTKNYNFVFFNSHDDGLVGNTNFTIGSTTVTLNATDNISKTVQINGVTTATGSVTIVIAKATGADYAFISTMIIQSYATTYTSVAPTNLRTTTITRNSIGLQWQDNSTNETGYQIWRAADSASAYTLLTTVAANSTTYTDANLTTNKTYSYAVRAVVGTSLYTNYSNTVSASTYAYSVYLNYTLNNNAALPWNNLDALPTLGYTWNNFYDEKGMITSTGQQLNTNWAGLYSAGMNPLNNSGIYPDTVMIDSYGLFPGQTATFQITGLNIGMKYNFTFYASSNAYGDVNVAYTINGVTTLLNTSLNVNGTETIYGVTPDAYGNVTVSLAAGTPASQFGLIGALVISGYTPSAAPSLPTLPGSTGSGSGAIAQTIQSANGNQMKAFPNPFHNNFMLQLQATNNASIQVMIYDASGKLVYTNNFSGVHNGNNELKIITSNNLTPGVYTVLAIDKDSKATKTIRLVKE